MLQSHCYHHVLFSIPSVPLSLPHSPSLSIPLTLSPFLNFLHKPTILHPVSATPPSSSSPWLTHLAELAATAQDGPIELPLSTPSIFATTDEPSTIQIATSVLLTGAITVFLFRSIRRRAKRAKELKFRSSGVKKSLKEEALDNLKAMGSSSIEAKGTPSPVQALIGGISAGIIALILYKFTTTIEAALNRQTVSDNFSVRQITITVRTIVNGLCYLATFVFGINSIGLFLYSGQLALNSLTEGSTEKKTESQGVGRQGLSNSSVEGPANNTQLSNRTEDETSNDKQ
ncbi:uncharacterized protein LOC129316093 isoform X1 [Prosopis cineraria]|uniref:uncharacterized protein LOC129316093 isoform X1 n=1 Tax=Prosopis cineraria TaxID=364024 RepID=UPI0024105942|nr:uncharacterized protein LOC129316093 isoform X1 [Prosopis cineraria]